MREMATHVLGRKPIRIESKNKRMFVRQKSQKQVKNKN